MLEKYIDKLKPYVISLFQLDSSGHDINHLIRTMNTTLYIPEKEAGKFVSPKDSIPKIKDI